MKLWPKVDVQEEKVDAVLGKLRDKPNTARWVAVGIAVILGCALLLWAI